MFKWALLFEREMNTIGPEYRAKTGQSRAEKCRKCDLHQQQDPATASSGVIMLAKEMKIYPFLDTVQLKYTAITQNRVAPCDCWSWNFIAGHTVRQASRFHTVTIQYGNFKMWNAQKLLQDFITTYQFSNLIAWFSGSSRGNPRQPAQLPQHHACGGTITSYGETIQFFRYAR